MAKDEKALRADRVVRALRGRTIAWLAEAAGIALSSAHSYVKGTVPAADIAVRVADALEVDLKWYVCGLGSAGGGPAGKVLDIPLVDHSFRAVGSIPYVRSLVGELGAEGSLVRCLLPKGSAMRPTVPEGSEVLFVPSGDLPEDGEIYVLSIRGRAVVRRLMTGAGGELRAVCDNPAFRTEEKEIVDPGDIVGKVIWVSYRP